METSEIQTLTIYISGKYIRIKEHWQLGDFGDWRISETGDFGNWGISATVGFRQLREFGNWGILAAGYF